MIDLRWSSTVRSFGLFFDYPSGKNLSDCFDVPALGRPTAHSERLSRTRCSKGVRSHWATIAYISSLILLSRIGSPGAWNFHSASQRMWYFERSSGRRWGGTAGTRAVALSGWLLFFRQA